MTNTPDKQGEALEFARVQDVLQAVSEFCDGTQPFVGERFKKQLRNAIRAVPRASVAAVGGDAQIIAREALSRHPLKLLSVIGRGPYEELVRIFTTTLNSRAAASSPAEPPPTAPRCPKCGYVMCQQFDSRPVNPLADIVTPNGTYTCYHCTPLQPTGEQESKL